MSHRETRSTDSQAGNVINANAVEPHGELVVRGGKQSLLPFLCFLSFKRSMLTPATPQPA
jgi:hypothetical protein